MFFPGLEAPGSSLPIYMPEDLESEHSCQGSGVRNVRPFSGTIKKKFIHQVPVQRPPVVLTDAV